MSEELKAAQARIACLEGEIAKRDERIVGLELEVALRDQALDRHVEYGKELRAELSAIKAQEPVANSESGLQEWAAGKFGIGGAFRGELCGNTDWALARLVWSAALAYAAPVSEAKAQGEYGDAYQGAREDLAIWKRRALEAEKALQEERIITERLGNALNEENGPTFMGEPVFPAKAQGVVMPEQVLSNETLWDIRNHVACNEVLQSDDSLTICVKHGRAIEAAVLARLNAAPVQQVIVPDEMRSLAQRLREYNQNPHHINPMSEAFHILVADAANAISTACVPKEIAAAITWSEHLLFECGALTSTRAPSVHVYNKTFAAVNEARAMLAAAPAAPAADAGLVEALDYQVLFDAIAAATSVYANGAVNISVQAFRDALAARRSTGVV